MVNIFITLVVYVKHMKKSEWLDCQRNEFFPKQKGIPSLVKIEHKNTATLDSARSKKKSKVAVLQLTRVKIDLYSLTFIKILKENLLQLVREVTIKINLYAQKRIPSIAIKNSSDTVCTHPTG